jgi:hypothetical protein
MFAIFPKNIDRKNIDNNSKIISRKNKKTSKARGYWGLE